MFFDSFIFLFIVAAYCKSYHMRKEKGAKGSVLRCLVYLALIGVGSFLLGRAVPKKCFRWDRFPYRAMAWEREGAVYQMLGIRRWQNRIPDMSRYLPEWMPAKSISGGADTGELEIMLRETCVAEWIHWLLCVLGGGCLWLWPGMGGVLTSVLYALGNLPFILVQRYNRPRLHRLWKKRKERERRT